MPYKKCFINVSEINVKRSPDSLDVLYNNMSSVWLMGDIKNNKANHNCRTMLKEDTGFILRFKCLSAFLIWQPLNVFLAYKTIMNNDKTDHTSM